MKTLDFLEMRSVTGAGAPNNSQIVKDLAIDAGLGAAFTPGMPWIGAGLGMATNVIHGAINNGPVNVPIPRVPMGPTWNGSGPGGRVCRIQGGYQFCEEVKYRGHQSFLGSFSYKLLINNITC